MKNILLVLLFFLLYSSCTKKKEFSTAEEEKKILELHHKQRDYHFNKDSIAFANQLSDNFISVNKGAVSNPKRSETLSRYSRYFSSVEFVKWDDVTDPIVKISDDGSMAYTIVDKIVEITYENENGEKTIEKTHFAWTTIYRKYGNEWKIDCVTSTEQATE